MAIKLILLTAGILTLKRVTGDSSQLCDLTWLWPKNRPHDAREILGASRI